MTTNTLQETDSPYYADLANVAEKIAEDINFKETTLDRVRALQEDALKIKGLFERADISFQEILLYTTKRLCYLYTTPGAPSHIDKESVRVIAYLDGKKVTLKSQLKKGDLESISFTIPYQLYCEATFEDTLILVRYLNKQKKLLIVENVP